MVDPRPHKSCGHSASDSVDGAVKVVLGGPCDVVDSGAGNAAAWHAGAAEELEEEEVEAAATADDFVVVAAAVEHEALAEGREPRPTESAGECVATSWRK